MGSELETKERECQKSQDRAPLYDAVFSGDLEKQRWIQMVSGQHQRLSSDYDEIDEDGHELSELFPVAPFSWITLTDVLRRFPNPFAERVVADGKVARLFASSDGGLHAVSLGREQLKVPRPIQEQVNHVFEIESTVRRELSKHDSSQVLGPAVELPVLRWEDSFAAMVSTIIEQQNNWKTATRDIDFLFSVANRRRGQLSVFPQPSEVLAHPEWMQRLGLTHRRRGMILGLAEEMEAVPLYLDALCVDLQQAEKKLLKLPGVGPWTARVFLSKRYGYRPDVPLNDVALQRAAAHFYLGEERNMSQEELADRLREFGALAGEAAHRILLRWVLERY